MTLSWQLSRNGVHYAGLGCRRCARPALRSGGPRASRVSRIVMVTEPRHRPPLRRTQCQVRATQRCAGTAMTNDQETHRAVTSYQDAPTRTIAAGGANFAYRELGPATGVPVIFLTHLAAVLDNWGPRVVDGIAARHPVITFDNRGVGASTGSTPDTIAAMAKDAVTFIRALGLDEVDLLGFSMGGMIAQVIAQDEPQLVRKLILAGTGPAGGEGIKNVTRISHLDTIRALLTFQDPKQFLFFTRTPNGRSPQPRHRINIRPGRLLAGP
jgi:hypothetical protein